MALKSGRVGVNPDQVDLHGRIKSITPPDLSDYVKKTDAPGYDDILTKTLAESTYQTQSGMSSYQPTLVSGTNIKTINGITLLGSGDIEVGGGGGDLSGYVQKIEAPGYDDILTQTSAASTYQTQSGMSDYQTVSGMSAYQTVSGMSDYVAKTDAVGYDDILTQTSAASTYQTQSGMSDYQTVSGMSNYVAKTDAPGYNDILTETEASTLYQPILVSGTNIKTLDNTSLLGSGNIKSKFYGISAVSTDVIATETKNSSGPLSYTATEDCWVYCYFKYHGGNTMYVKIGGKTFFTSVDNGGNGITATCVLPLKTGQTIELSKSGYHAGYDYSYTAYRIKG